MFWKKKIEIKKPVGAAPPWENIDNVPRMSHIGSRFNLVAFTNAATGLGEIGSRLFLLMLVVGLGFVTYLMYGVSQQEAPLPPNHNRPAIDKYASSTTRI